MTTQQQRHIVETRSRRVVVGTRYALAWGYTDNVVCLLPNTDILSAAEHKTTSISGGDRRVAPLFSGTSKGHIGLVV
jgi:hypothetical protein